MAVKASVETSVFLTSQQKEVLLTRLRTAGFLVPESRDYFGYIIPNQSGNNFPRSRSSVFHWDMPLPMGFLEVSPSEEYWTARTVNSDKPFPLDINELLRNILYNTARDRYLC